MRATPPYPQRVFMQQRPGLGRERKRRTAAVGARSDRRARAQRAGARVSMRSSGNGFGTLRDRGVLTPYVGLSLVGDAARGYRLGRRLAVGQSATVSLEAERQQHLADAADSMGSSCSTRCSFSVPWTVCVRVAAMPTRVTARISVLPRTDSSRRGRSGDRTGSGTPRPNRSWCILASLFHTGTPAVRSMPAVTRSRCVRSRTVTPVPT